MRFFLILPNDRDAGLLRARINLHDDLLHDRIGKRPVDDADREGLQFVYAGTTFCTTESASDRSTMRIVKGCSLCTRALPAFRSFLALAGPQGISGLWSLSRTKTFIMFVYLTVTDELLAERAVPNRNVPLANVNDQRFQQRSNERNEQAQTAHC